MAPGFRSDLRRLALIEHASFRIAENSSPGVLTIVTVNLASCSSLALCWIVNPQSVASIARGDCGSAPKIYPYYRNIGLEAGA
jgi:hypothetical protein